MSVQTMRVVTLNIWGNKPPLERRMAIIERGIRELSPDVLALQEVGCLQGKLPNQALTIAARVQYQAVWEPALKEASGYEEGVAILSRFPIEAHESLPLPGSDDDEPRVVLMARVAFPGVSVNCYTTHLSYQMTHGLERERQVMALDEFVRRRPGAEPQIIMGDFNASSEHDEIRFLRGLHTIGGRRTAYQDAYLRVHRVESDGGVTWARRNPFTERHRWLERDRRVDYIFVTPPARDGRGEVKACSTVFDRPESDGCFASDHFGVMADVQVVPDGSLGSSGHETPAARHPGPRR
jgi:endonuclease/exonuclease/phosphatase family metal-dependent hydrolase